MHVPSWLPLESFAGLDLLPTLAAALLHFLWQGALIALLLKLALAGCDAKQVNLRYAMSLFAMFLLVAAVPVTMFVLAGSDSPAAAKPSSITAEVAALDRAAIEPLIAIGEAAEVAGDLPATALPGWQPWLVAAWLAGVICFSLRLSLGWIGTVELRRSGQAAGPELQSQVKRLARQLGIRRTVMIGASRRVSGAMVMGLLRPMILAPACWLSETSPEVLEAVLAHELAHIRRGDLWVNLVQRIVETLLFYHPAVWWISACVRRERELCCDQLAIAVTGRPVDYAKALEWAARQRLDQGQLGWAAAFMGERNMTLKQRVQLVLGISANQPGRSWPVALAGLGLAVVVGLATFGGNALNTAAADDGDRKPEAEQPRDGDREVRREGDRQPEASRDGDRPREEVRREGDRPAEVRRDGDRELTPAQREERARAEALRRDQQARGEGEQREREELARRLSGAKNEDLVRMILEMREQLRQLSMQVNAMQRERAEGRDRGLLQRDGERREGDRPLLRDGERREGDRPILRDGERRETDRPREEIRRDGDRPREEVRRDGDREEERETDDIKIEPRGDD